MKPKLGDIIMARMPTEVFEAEITNIEAFRTKEGSSGTWYTVRATDDSRPKVRIGGGRVQYEGQQVTLF